MRDRKNATIGILLLNLGGPDSLQAVRPFLYNLFSDREIIKLGPPLFQKPLAWLMAKFRSTKTKQMYGVIGGKSPILEITTAQAQALENVLNQATGQRTQTINSKLQTLNSRVFYKVYIGMRYWHPFIGDTVQRIVSDGIERLLVLSLYPHYSKATTGSSISEFQRVIAQSRISDANLHIKYIKQWYDFPPYIDSLAELIFRGFSEFHGERCDILFSAHNLPEDFIKSGDPYIDHVKATIDATMTRLSSDPYNMTGVKWHLSFQSKSGPVTWLNPSTDEKIIELSKKGFKQLFVVPISFVSDHIETLYEVSVLYRELAMRHGINLIRCESLNTSEKFIQALKELVIKNLVFK
jgi:ferrochelatase